jgi:hypothetical protein
MGRSVDFLYLGIYGHGQVDHMEDRSKIVISTPFIGLPALPGGANALEDTLWVRCAPGWPAIVSDRERVMPVRQ